MDTTEHDLKLLSIGYYVQGGVVTASALMALAYVGLIGTVLGAVSHATARNQMPPGLLPLIIGFGVATVLIGVTGGLSLFYAGLMLRRHRHRTFLLVMASLSCLAIPYGTLLGIFTFMVLQRPAARAMFGQEPVLP